MQRTLFRYLCFLVSLCGTAAGLLLPLYRVTPLYLDLSILQLLRDYRVGNSYTQAYLLLVPLVLGVLTAFLCMYARTGVMVLFSLLTALSMPLLTLWIRSSLLEAATSGSGYLFGDALGNIINGLLSSAYDKAIVSGSGFYLFAICFAVVMILAMVGHKRKSR